MKYSVEFTGRAVKELKKLDKPTRLLLMAWIRKNLQGCTNPRLRGKGLAANHREKWRYRVGDYRLLAEIQDGKLIILMVAIGHRRSVYK
jgi:mRNA interferase RelE/StbE